MNGETFRRRLVVTNPQGFHLRPLAAFAEVAGRFQSSVTLCRPDTPEADGKSPLALMGLAAEQGAELWLQVCGPDAPAALHAILELLRNLSVAEEAPDPPLTPKG
jgi:phosphotransferase system HPr (HPr) family protein